MNLKTLIFSLLMFPVLCFASNWVCINRNLPLPTCNTWRWEVPNGWLVSADNGDSHVSLTFYPDPEHKWKV